MSMVFQCLKGKQKDMFGRRQNSINWKVVKGPLVLSLLHNVHFLIDGADDGAMGRGDTCSTLRDPSQVAVD